MHPGRRAVACRPEEVSGGRRFSIGLYSATEHLTLNAIKNMTHKNFQTMRKDIDAAIGGGEERHFLDFHFANHNEFAEEFIELMCVLEDICPGAGCATVKKISSLRGENRATYDQIIQALCELVIGKRFIEAFPADAGFKLHWEPTDHGESESRVYARGCRMARIGGSEVPLPA
jgi:hypothetical protein